ncbi:MAG: MarR family transcriptional regulator [Candidatus Electrothrix sp. LOE1_4_5]|nr:MarR family transcriptional regulator [Candidatus Electrothrix gigas]
MADQQTREQAGYIFSVGKMIRDHMHNSLTLLHRNDRHPDGCDLSIAQMNLLMTVRSHEELTLSRLAELLKVSPPSVSVMVERLVERKMLTRNRSSTDRRKVIISLSPESQQRIETMEEQMLAAFIALVEELGPETARKWGEVLEQVEEVLGRQNRQGKEICS